MESLKRRKTILPVTIQPAFHWISVRFARIGSAFVAFFLFLFDSFSSSFSPRLDCFSLLFLHLHLHCIKSRKQQVVPLPYFLCRCCFALFCSPHALHCNPAVLASVTSTVFPGAAPWIFDFCSSCRIIHCQFLTVAK